MTIEIEINTQIKQGTQIAPFANLLVFVQQLIQSFKNSKKPHMWLRVQLSCQEPSTINFYKSLVLIVILSCWPAWRAVVSTGHNESEHCNHMVEGFEWDWLQKKKKKRTVALKTGMHHKKQIFTFSILGMKLNNFMGSHKA